MKPLTPKQKVQNYIAEKKVMMFSKSYCPFCAQAKAKLKKAKIEYHAIELDKMKDGNAIHDALKSYSK